MADLISGLFQPTLDLMQRRRQEKQDLDEALALEQRKEERALNLQRQKSKIDVEAKTKLFRAQLEDLVEAGFDDVRPGITAGGNLTARVPTQEQQERSQLRGLHKRALTGEPSLDVLQQLQTNFPIRFGDLPQERQDLIERRLTPVEKSPGFTKGTGGLISRFGSFMSGSQAEVPEETQFVINQIKSQDDLQEHINRRDEAEAEGIDVKAILEYFAQQGLQPIE